MNELDQLKMLSESIARIENGPSLTEAEMFTIGGVSPTELTVKQAMDFYNKNVDKWVAIKKADGYDSLGTNMSKNEIKRKIADGNFQIFNLPSYQFTDQGLAAGSQLLKSKGKSKGKSKVKAYKRKENVKTDYNAGDEIQVDVKEWTKIMMSMGYDQEDIEDQLYAVDDGEGVILDGVVEDDGDGFPGMFVDINGDEFIVPFAALSHTGGNAFGVEYDDEGNETNADDEERSFDRSRMYR